MGPTQAVADLTIAAAPALQGHGGWWVSLCVPGLWVGSLILNLCTHNISLVTVSVRQGLEA